MTRVLPPLGRFNRRERRRVARLAKRDLRAAGEQRQVRARPQRPERVRAAMRDAFEVWGRRFPWRLLPLGARLWSLETFGKAFVSSYVTERLDAERQP